MLKECWIAILLWGEIASRACFECDVALHVDTTTSARSSYKIFQKSTTDVPEDQVNVTKGLTEAPNQSSEDVDLLTSDPPVRQAPDITHYFNYTAISIYLRILCIKFLGNFLKP
jgi:hypothetical protein